MFATRYLGKNKNIACIEPLPVQDTGIIVVIPCLKELNIVETLESLYACEHTVCRVEIIILINHSLKASPGIRELNRISKEKIDNWIIDKNSVQRSFFPVGPVELPPKWAGAGLARKRGMDEAVRRFNILDNPEGVIVSLDADTIVEKNYLQAIESYFNENPKDAGATIAVKHLTEGLSDKHLEGIRLYEKYMVYYKEALKYTGYPHAMFTVGSAFAVRAGAYVRRGGMNRRQAGEDFYFMQNLVETGRVGEINTTTVHPSARVSDRVPFGTGPVMERWLEGKSDLTKTYNFRAFNDLRQFFDKKDKLYLSSYENYVDMLSELPRPVALFLELDNFWGKVDDLNRNCSNLVTFQKRFYQKFNAFRILKFLNFTHEKYYNKADIDKQAAELEYQW